MTVGELITVLSQYDKDSEVLIYDYESLEDSKIDMISHEANKVILFYE